MASSDLAELSANILLQYYDNQIQPFLDHCHDDIFWIGPAQKHIIRTKDALVKAFFHESHNLRFAVHNLNVIPMPVSRSCTEVFLAFTVDTFWPNGSSNQVNQRITLSWDSKFNPPLIRLCHISNAIDYDTRDMIYPTHYLNEYFLTSPSGNSTQKLHFNGNQKMILYADAAEILYIESTGGHTKIHTLAQAFECTERLSSIARRLGGSFLRCHSSFLVNPMHVKSIERFSLTMCNDQKIPVPEKKYTAVKAALLSEQGNKNEPESVEFR